MTRTFAIIAAVVLVALACDPKKKTGVVGVEGSSGEEEAGQGGEVSGAGETAGSAEAPPSEESLDERVVEFLETQWLEPQRQGNVDGYGTSLTDDFEGTILMSTGEKKKLDREEWLKRRARALEGKKPTIRIEDVQVEEAGSDEITVKLQQTWETDVYCDVGEKELTLAARGDGFLVRREVMVSAGECPWASVASLLTFLKNYQSAWEGEDIVYLAEHTAMPFPFETVITRGEGEGEPETEELEKLSVFMDRQEVVDLVGDVSYKAHPTKQRLGERNCEYEARSVVEENTGTVTVSSVKCALEDSFVLTLTFAEDRWTLSSIRNEQNHPE